MIENMRIFEDDLPPVNAITPPPLPEGFELRDIQQVGYNNLIKAYLAGHRTPVLQMGTGTGKTKLAGFMTRLALEKNPNQRIVFIVPLITLLDQAYEDFSGFFGLETSVIMADDERLDLRKQVQICTAQTLLRRIKKNPVFAKLEFGLGFIDEAHKEFSDRTLINCNFIVGLTATPYGKRMGLYHDTLVKTIPTADQRLKGIITPLCVMSAKRTTQINRSELHITSTGEYAEEDEEAAVTEIIANVVEEYSKSDDMRGRKVLVFAKTIDSCVALCEEFLAYGFRFSYIHSKMSTGDCNAQKKMFEAGFLDGLVSVVKLIEGYDHPQVDGIIVVTVFAPSKNDPRTPNALSRYIQIPGRGCRGGVPGKEYCLMHDHGGNYFDRFDDPDSYEVGFTELYTGKEKKTEQEKPAERKLKTVECSVCDTLVQGRRCPKCLTELKTFSEVVEGQVVEYVEGEMVQVTPKPEAGVSPVKKPKQMTKNEKQDLYSGLKFNYQEKMIERGKKPFKDGFVAYRYKDITGVMPRGINQKVSKETEIGNNATIHLNIVYQNSKGKRK